MQMHINLILLEFAKAYGLHKKVQNGHIYMNIICEIYSLPQADVLAKNLLKSRLLQHGYFKLPHMLGFLCTKQGQFGSLWQLMILAKNIWRKRTQNIWFQSYISFTKLKKIRREAFIAGYP